MNGFQKWVARKLLGVETRSLTYTQSMPTYLNNQPYRPEWDIERAVDDGYKASSIVYLCVKRKADAIASVPFKLYRPLRDGNFAEIDQGALARLLKHPNEQQTQSKLTWRWASNLSLGGNTIISKVRVTKRPEQLWALLPKGIYPVISEDSYIDHYLIKRDGRYSKLDPNDVIHDQLPDPANPFWGIGELQALAVGVDSDVYSQKHLATSMLNRGMPSGVLMIKRDATEEQYKTTKDFVKAEISGNKNHGKTFVIDQQLEYQQLTQTFQELEFIEARQLTREEIAIGFGLDPVMLGFNNSATYANKQWARYTFWVDVIMPLAKDIASEFTSGLVHEFYKRSERDDFVIAPDFGKVEALVQMYKERADTAKILIDAGYDPDEVAEKLDLNLKVSVQKPEPPAPADEPEPEPTPTDDSDSRRIKVAEVRRYFDRAAYWTRADSKRQTFEARVSSSVNQLFDRFASNTANMFILFGHNAAVNTMQQEKDHWNSLLKSAYQASAESFGNDVYRELYGQDAPDVWRQKAKALAEDLAPSRANLIGDSGMKAIRELLEQARLKGFDRPTIAAGIREVYGRWGVSRAGAVARTEIGLAMNRAQYEMAEYIEQHGDAVVKEWVSQQDGKVRPSHAAVDGERRALKDVFSNGLLYPNDPTGDPLEVVNCRCVVRYSRR